jgi:hypothetical protein
MRDMLLRLTALDERQPEVRCVGHDVGPSCSQCLYKAIKCSVAAVLRAGNCQV